MLRVRLVGRPSLELDGQAIGWPPGRRAGELLAWLALNPGAHARADLAPRFWPEVLDESARASLRTALHELRRDLGDAGEHVAATRDAVGLDDEAWVDVRELRRALAEGRDDDALSLAGGELLQGIDAEWVYAAREDHRELVGQALGRLSARASAAGDAAAVGLARRRAALDPLAEEPARELMRLLADRGDRAAAMAAYEALRKRMASDLRAAPSPATREFAAELRGSGTGQAIAGGPGPRRLAQRLAEEARRTFVGRAAELESLGELIGERRPAAAVVFISGPGGVGKSRLLHAALDRAGDDVRIASLDCRDVEPTPAGFLAAACEALGAQARDPGAEFVADLIGADGRRTVLALDTYETFGLMDAWMRRTFLPLLPEQALTIIAGREPPGRAWLTSPGWHGLLSEIRLDSLDDPDAVALLGALGLSGLPARRANGFAHGHPLALELAAAAVRAHPGLELADGPPASVIGQLVDAFLEGLEPETIEAVRAASLLRRVDEPLLGAVVDGQPAGEAYERLRGLPFCQATAEGLVLHDVVRETVARDLAQRDPRRAAGLRRRAAEALGRPAGAPRLWQTTADLLYLVENPAVRSGFFPEGAADLEVEPAGPADAGPIRRIADAWESPEAAAAIGRWWTVHPEAFSAARGADGRVSGFSAQLERAALDPSLLAGDPVAAAWAADLEARPVEDRELVLLVRRFLSEDGGEAMGAAMAALFLDIKRLYMAMRPRLRRVYTVAADVSDMRLLSPLGFSVLPHPVPMGDVEYHPLLLDFGPESVDGWLAGLIAAESRTADPADAALTVS